MVINVRTYGVRLFSNIVVIITTQRENSEVNRSGVRASDGRVCYYMGIKRDEEASSRPNYTVTSTRIILLFSSFHPTDNRPNRNNHQ